MATNNVEKRIIELIEDYARVVSNRYGHCDVYLYGSYVTGAYTVDSDIDVAVVSDSFHDNLVNETFHLMKLRRSIDTRIEPHPFQRNDFTMQNPFAREIILTGIPINS